jgi:GAF domain-containing protein
MFSFAPTDPADKPTLYADLLSAARALVADEPDGIANMANVAALLWQFLPDLNWAGFYRLVGDILIVGPFQGRPACVRIPVGTGVCGTAAARRATVRVDDVHAFPGHIACDTASASEIVLPVFARGVLIGVLDLDSPCAARFDATDAAGLETLLAAIGDALAPVLPLSPPPSPSPSGA